ncbi:hypothetical protein C8R46DRAFT_1186759 [Mycena filopes]|nr:hypothetical protein C8R46DRAFT_1186759 [Mycena filopes]
MTRLLGRLPGGPILASLWAHEVFGCPVSLLASLALVQTLQGVVKAGFRDPANPTIHELPLPLLAAVELAKCAVAVTLLYGGAGVRFWGKFGGRAVRYVSLPDEALPLHSMADDERDFALDEERRREDEGPAAQHHYTTKRIYLAVAPIVALYIIRHQLMVARRPYATQSTLDSVDALMILFVGLYTYLLLGRTTPLRHWTSAFLQITAISLVHRVVKVPEYSAATYSLLFLSATSTALILVVTCLVYHTLRDVPFHKLNIALFSSCFAVYALAMLLLPSPPPSTPHHQMHPRDVIASGIVLLLQITADFISLTILRRSSAFTVASTTLLSASLTPPLFHIVFWTVLPFHNVQWLAAALAIYAALSYLLDSPASPSSSASTNPTTLETPPLPQKRTLVFVALALAPLLGTLAFHRLTPLPRAGRSFVWNPETADMPRKMPHEYDALLSANETACTRRPLPVSSDWIGPGARPDFHAFDDVLLVVFFSHDRYDINLDGYREVYSQYFPNILFIGPASREDRGFLYSYDVVLDSYMSKEDFNAGWFKMGGRMAHHMLYTAVKDYPCYAGYLWAPFDALLNVPRFMQFPQDHIWYHSPFAERFVDNPAQQGQVEVQVLRPPAAIISERSAGEYLLEANAWGAGWIWCEKHMGLEVCMPAYERVPLHMRQRLEGFIGGPGHLIGGSADTLYLPGHLRSPFLDVLGTFLQTDCFLEIAVPTTLHLILPVGEEIAWVDHWWKHPPPWNTTYVREKWDEGYEVDSFHSFHWGDTQDDGFFGPNKNSVADMRTLLADSFERQRIRPPT